MIAADQIRMAILSVARKKGAGNPFPLSQVARELDLANWEELMEPVELVAEVLVLQGYLERKGDNVVLVMGKEKLI
ncbi:MAG: DUF3253 domain-containing protein [Cyclobacteriaceae bacterium]